MGDIEIVGKVRVESWLEQPRLGAFGKL